MALEIVEMDSKLRDSHPSVKLPTLPINASALPLPPPKRKSAFLNTLSRLASPSGNKSSGTRHVSQPRSSSSSGQHSQPMSSQASVASSSAQTPVVSPAREINDPFTSLAQDATTPLPTNATVTSLAAYLTSLANDSTIRQSRTWKRFVRVRTDDLQSVRVERAIKRVRSDLAAHAGTSSTRSVAQVLVEDAQSRAASGQATPAEGSVNGDQNADDQASTVEAGAGETVVDAEKPHVNGDGMDSTAIGDQDRAATPQDPKRVSSVTTSPAESKRSSLNGLPTPLTPSTSNGEANEPQTPVAADPPSSHASRIPRSQSADPGSRSSRIIYSPGSILRDGTSSQTSVTGDDSSISTSRSARKKRSKSADPKKSQRKVAIDDFEMMRVLGKGCAGKVLLVKHKPTSDVFALKAITKRHVLAHQELQHTLTEQAVLKRMAAEGTDPFVVKLWWSFHDKENLFLVMVSVATVLLEID